MYRIIGLDIGSSTIKAGILDLDSGAVTDLTREAFPERIAGLPSHHFEVDPDEVVRRVAGLIHRLATAAPDIDSIFCCGQMGGVLLCNQKLRPLTNYLSWRDQRTTLPNDSGLTTLESLRNRWTDSMFEVIGSELKPGSATSLLFWLQQRRQLPDQATPVTLGDYVVSKLCGVPLQMERTQTIGMLNLRTGDWYHEAFAHLHLEDLHWPQLTTTDHAAGTMVIAGRSLSIYPVVGDQQAALRGIDLQPHELSVNLSTGAQVSQITATFQPAQCQSRSWFHGQFLNTITHIPAGRSLNVLESLLTELARRAGLHIEDSWNLIAQAVSQSEGGGLRSDLSFFAGALGCEGRIEGITTENLTVGNLFQSAFDFMADSCLTCSQRLNPQPAWHQLAVSGGLVQSFPTLRQKLQDRFRLPFREVAEQEETLLGLLKIAREMLRLH
ncbi:MAG: hypothetical protein KDB01_20310 [Planctomycetaceae bacterium]|nr:hypothetical protein [Planctomycetaceae bacterium]